MSHYVRRGFFGLLCGTSLLLGAACQSAQGQDTQAGYTSEEIFQQGIVRSLEGSVWNNIELQAGRPGFLWLLGKPVREGDRIVNPWHFSNETGLPQVGYWELDGQKITFKARNGVVLGVADYNEVDHTLTGHLVKPNSKVAYGKIQLQRESFRPYRLILTDSRLRKTR